ncbi:putative metal-binding motif-containing protein, partial [Thermodesulfobacteriota bacterium]
YRICANDCDDSRSVINPGAHEIFDGLDSNCDGTIPDNETNIDTGGNNGGGGPGNPPEHSLEVTPAVAMGSSLQQSRFYIRNATGLGRLEWHIESITYISGSNWISRIAPSGGKTTSESQVLLRVSRDGMAPGKYEAAIHVRSNAGVGSVQVLMTVAEAAADDDDDDDNGGDDDTPPVPAPACTQDADCDDALFCNGEERCEDDICTAGDAPCATDELCMEEEQECWAVSTIQAESMQTTLRRPRWLPRRCLRLVLKAEGAQQFDSENCTTRCFGPSGETRGVVVNPGREILQLGNRIIVSLCIEKDAARGDWNISLETLDGTSMQIIEAGFVIQ